MRILILLRNPLYDFLGAGIAVYEGFLLDILLGLVFRFLFNRNLFPCTHF